MEKYIINDFVYEVIGNVITVLTCPPVLDTTIS